MKYAVSVCLISGLMILFAGLIYPQRVVSQETPFDWRSDWAAEKDFSIELDSEGYHFPTAIAFVPNPGSGPKDPLYFITELRGKVKVVTNDRSIYTFAESFLQTEFYDEAPDEKAEFGLAGICLEPKHGYVFVTFAYQDSAKFLRNNVIRFESQPETFSLKASSDLAFTDVFLPYESGPSHQIGPCQIKDDLLYVSIGDGFKSPRGSQQIDSLLGKVTRMTLDGNPVADNPFYQDDDIKKASNYVWAYGLRNPFGLKILEDRVFVADNGLNIDRFMEVHAGENYLWDGSDWSIGANAAVVLTPSIGPVQLDYYPENLSIFPEQFREKFFLGASAIGQGKTPGVITLEYGLQENKILSVPKYFLKYRGSTFQRITGLAFGPDGLYFVPVMPNQVGQSAVFKISYDPNRNYPFTLVQNEDPVTLMQAKGCFGCHTVNDRWAGGTAGPPLGGEAMVSRLQTRLNSEAYVTSLKEIDKLDAEPYRSFKEARNEVLTKDGLERVRVWLKYRIQEPRFDNVYSQMPNLGLSEQEALLITDYLLPDQNKSGLSTFVSKIIPGRLDYKHLFLFSVGGFVLGGTSSWLILYRFNRKPGLLKDIVAQGELLNRRRL